MNSNFTPRGCKLPKLPGLEKQSSELWQGTLTVRLHKISDANACQMYLIASDFLSISLYNQAMILQSV